MIVRFCSTARQCAINPIDPLKIGVEINVEISKYEIEQLRPN
jgi:hypothetical protein